MFPEGKIGQSHDYQGEKGWVKTWINGADFQASDPSTKEAALYWVHDLANPWDETAVSYEMRRSKGLVFADTSLGEWIAEYTSIVYDDIMATAIAYGTTPQEALQNVIDLVTELIKTYCKEDTK